MPLNRSDLDHERTGAESSVDQDSSTGSSVHAAVAEPDSASTDSRDATGQSEVISASHAEKLHERRYKWIVDYRMLGWGAAAVAGVFILAAASYAFNSRRAATTFLSRADQAAADGNPAEEVRWLQNYLLLHPEDDARLLRSAIAADVAAEQATRENIGKRVMVARKRLALALSGLSRKVKATNGQDEELVAECNDVRKRYINRLLQSGGYSLADARDQVIELDANKNDPKAHYWMACAIASMVETSRYRQPDIGKLVKDDSEYYLWLSQQLPGEIVTKALTLNPGDLELASHLYTLLSESPEAFGVVLANEDRDVFQNTLDAIRRTDEQHFEIIDQVRVELENQENSRAKLLLFNYLVNVGQIEQARNVLMHAAAKASQRLSELEIAAAADASNDEGQNIDEDRMKRAAKLSPEAEASVMDYLCVLQAVGFTANQIYANGGSNGFEDQLTAARTWLEQLRGLGIYTVPVSSDAVKRVYLVSGQLEQADRQIDKAVEFWRAGLKVVSEDNLDLFGSVAWGLASQALTARLDDPSVEKSDELEDRKSAATKAIQEFSTSIVGKERLLNRMTSDELGAIGRAEAVETIRNAKWKCRVAKATLLSADAPNDENDRQIIQLLTGAAVKDSPLAVASQMLVGNLVDRETTVEPQVRQAGIELLASAYQRREAWDLVGALLAQAAEIFGGNPALAQSLIQQSGEAWTRAGNRMQAAQQYQRIQNSVDPRVRLLALEAEFTYQLRLLPEQREIALLRASLDDLEKYFDSTEEQTDNPALKDLSAERLQLRVLRAQLPPVGVAAIDHLQSVDLANEILKLAEEHPDNKQLKRYAIERFAAAGEIDKAQELVASIVDDPEVSDGEKAVMRARVLAEMGKNAEAAKVLIELLKDGSPHDPLIARYASELALRGRDFVLAEEALKTVSDERLTPSLIYNLYQIAVASEDDEKAKSYLAELKRHERYDPSAIQDTTAVYSLLIETKSTIETLLDRQQGIERDDRTLAEVRNKITRLQSLRPNWGEAVGLRGWVSFAQGNFKTAINQLRSGINAGDQRMRTRQMLWRALMEEGQYDEAEREIRLASFATRTDVDPYDEVSNQIAIENEKFEQALQASKKVAEENPSDPYAWLTYAKFVNVIREKLQGSDNAEMSQDVTELLKTAQDAIAHAESIAKTEKEKYAVESTRVGLVIAIKNQAELSAELDRIANLSIAENQRLQLEARVLVALDRIDDAIAKLRQANELEQNLNVQRMLAQLLRTSGKHDESIKIWRQALANDRNNPIIRTQLATTIVSSGKDIDWDEIATLLNDQRNATEQNRLVYAMLLMSKGDFFQRQEAIRQLRLLSGSSTEVGTEAARMQAALLIDLVENSNKLPDEQRGQLDLEQMKSEARQILQRLSSRDNAGLTDRRNYAVFLLRSGEPEDLQIASEIIEQMKRDPDAALEVLRLSILLSNASKSSDQLPMVVQDWAQNVAGEGDRVDIVAGEALMRSGYVREGLTWFKKAYAEDESTYGNYIVALSIANQYDEAAKIAAEQFEKSPTPLKAVLLVEALLSLDPNILLPRYQQIFDQAEADYGTNPAVLESLGTWAMQKRKFERAIALYLKAIEQDPRRPRALNNLAMVFAETPGRAKEGLQWINQAIMIAGDKAELLDTKGTVLLRSSRPVEAVEVFKQAIRQSKDPRYMFHLVEALVELGKESQAEFVWGKIDFSKIDNKALTQSERQSMRELHKRFGTKSTVPDESASTMIDFNRYTERVEFIATN
ncbi:tetratricopeptide repeat protein [Rhodopirellula sp. MGV]|uniref:tetratricopeptide repeat protein n=1 Tax=Rhodopirellula sp. MGV TaxID=2023130 RepID=UPI000B9711F4|nr:tetratricopeptide repeat protein [Rhodopirellula sp. MGV]OYP33029.1 hypothetical protein CGZ80_19260 [Rhodopirellula sp. MGV]PNY35308.1 hypothetical protein C2E31_17420 [Rhodopirellula baltica]